ncbi:glycosyl hydrolase-related protein [Geobacillus stearothermophilus]|uniref:glycosyl hydrolase-related protein n=1 Tax=Geobacillus stearothermophilus TaxID=1422 RepID=UPI003D247DF3
MGTNTTFPRCRAMKPSIIKEVKATYSLRQNSCFAYADIAYRLPVPADLDSILRFYNPAPKATTAVFQWNKPLLGVFRTNLNEELLDSLVADECGTFAVEVKPNEVQTVLVVDKQ